VITGAVVYSREEADHHIEPFISPVKYSGAIEASLNDPKDGYRGIWNSISAAQSTAVISPERQNVNETGSLQLFDSMMLIQNKSLFI